MVDGRPDDEAVCGEGNEECREEHPIVTVYVTVGYLPGDIETLGVEGHGVGLVLYGAVDHAEVDAKPTGVGVEVQQDDWGGVGSDFGGCFGEIEAVHLGFEGLVWIEGLLGVVAGASWCEYGLYEGLSSIL